MTISSVRAVTVHMPLPRALPVGPISIASREYLIVEITADSGDRGIGFGMTRGAPLAALIHQHIAPLLIGADPMAIERAWQLIYARNFLLARGGLFMWAMSAIDIAMWDLKARILRLPLWRMLGGSNQPIPVQVAGCYPGPDAHPGAVSDEVSQYVHAGYRMIKLAAGPIDLDGRRIAAARAAAPDARLSYDVHWGWTPDLDVIPTVRSWNEFRLAIIEDPYPSHMSHAIDRLRALTGIAVAMGEDMSDRWATRDLLRSGRVDQLRVDATTLGGISEAVKVLALASAEGVSVSPHVFPEIHLHLAATFRGVEHVEITEPSQGYESLHSLFTRWLDLANGNVTPSDEFGIGLEIDWDVAERYSRA